MSAAAHRAGPLLLALCVSPACAATPPAPDAAYLAEIDAARLERDKRLRAEDGWLSLVGLYWLSPGENPAGSGADNVVVLDAPGIPERAGTFVLDSAGVRVVAAGAIQLGGEPVPERVIRDDAHDDTDVLSAGRLRLTVIRRGDRFAVRVRDPESPARLGFHGIDHYPVDPAYRVEAKLERHAEPKALTIATVQELSTTMYALGTLHFAVQGKDLSMQALAEAPDATDLFVMLKDETSGSETYGAGRYLAADVDGDRVVLDFNRAYNPPCAFTSFATCPLPPRENWLATRIQAGERAPQHSD